MAAIAAIYLTHFEWIQIFLIVIGLLIANSSFSQKWLSRWSLISRLSITGVVLLVTGVLAILYRSMSSSSFIVQDLQQSESQLIGINVFAFLVFLALLLLLKSILYHQQSRYTNPVFRLFLLVLTIKVFSPLFISGGHQNVWMDEFDTINFINIFFKVLLVLFFLIGFRCKWVHYLNKSQKIGLFFLGSALIIGLVPAASFFIDSLGPSHVFIREFVEGVLTFCYIYSGLCLFSILLILPSAGFMDRKTNELKMLQQLSNKLSQIFAEKELFQEAVHLCRRLISADYLWIESCAEHQHVLLGVEGIAREEISTLPRSCQDNLRHLLSKNEIPLFIPDLGSNRVFKDVRKWLPRSGALMGIKIPGSKECDLNLYAIHRNRFGFTDNHQRLLTTFSEHLTVAIQNSQLLKQTIEQQVYKEELKMAHEAQMRLLPKEFPELANAQIGGFCWTANDIGGDFFDVIPINENRVDIIIGDVSGKGADAAFYMAELKGMIQPLAHHHQSPKDIFIELNDMLYDHFEANTFVTMIYAIYYPKSKKLTWVRAGHPPIGLGRKNKITWHMTKGLGLGLVKSETFNNTIEEKSIQLKANDFVFYYTDGLTEARDVCGDEFGEERTDELFASILDIDNEEALEKIKARMRIFTDQTNRSDDITVLLLTMNK